MASTTTVVRTHSPREMRALNLLEAAVCAALYRGEAPDHSQAVRAAEAALVECIEADQKVHA